MKCKIFFIALLVGAVTGFTSCGDYLDETPNKSGSAYIYHMDQLYGLTGSVNLYFGNDDLRQGMRLIKEKWLSICRNLI